MKRLVEFKKFEIKVQKLKLKWQKYISRQICRSMTCKWRIGVRKCMKGKSKWYDKIMVIEIWFLFFDFFKLKLLLINMTNRETYINTPFLRKLNHILIVKFMLILGSRIPWCYQMGWERHHDRYLRLGENREGDSSKIFSSFKIWEFCSAAKFVRISKNEEEKLPQISTSWFS